MRRQLAVVYGIVLISIEANSVDQSHVGTKSFEKKSHEENTNVVTCALLSHYVHVIVYCKASTKPIYSCQNKFYGNKMQAIYKVGKIKHLFF